MTVVPANPQTFVQSANLTNEVREIFIPIQFESPGLNSFAWACLEAPWPFDIIDARTKTQAGEVFVKVVIQDRDDGVEFDPARSPGFVRTDNCILSGPTGTILYEATGGESLGTTNRVEAGESVKVVICDFESTEPVQDLAVQLLIRRIRDIDPLTDN